MGIENKMVSQLSDILLIVILNRLNHKRIIWYSHRSSVLYTKQHIGTSHEKVVEVS
jgi:hypothetical protein